MLIDREVGRIGMSNNKRKLSEVSAPLESENMMPTNQFENESPHVSKIKVSKSSLKKKKTPTQSSGEKESTTRKGSAKGKKTGLRSYVL